MADAHRFGAYGFRLVIEDLDLELSDLHLASDDADRVLVEWRANAIESDRIDVGEDEAHVGVAGIAAFHVCRSPASILIEVPESPQPEAVVHPLMTTPLAILSRWRGDVCLHAGAVLHDGAAVAVCGHQGAGKSTTMAGLAARGLPIVTDDLLVMRNGEALAGPSCVDLRADSRDRFPDAVAIGIIGARERFRLSTPPAPARSPLRAVFLLEWADGGEPEVVPLDVAERAALVHGFDYAAMIGLPAATALMDMLALPMWRLRRPREWNRQEDALDLLLETAATA